MRDVHRSYREVTAGATTPQAVAVHIAREGNSGHTAVLRWPAVDDIDSGESSFIDIAAALDAAEAMRTRHGLSEVVVVLHEGAVWQSGWGELRALDRADASESVLTDQLSDEESYKLAAGLETQSDA